MDIIQAIIMGIVQGLSEFLPISSSAHLVFVSNFYKYFKGIEIIPNTEQEVFLDIMLHLGTLIAVLIFFRKDILAIIKAFYLGIKDRDFSSDDCKIGVYIIFGTFLTVIVAVPLMSFSEWLMFKPQFVGLILVITGLILLLSEYMSKKIKEKKELNMKRALLIGLTQGIASIPGFSRSGLTIAAGLFSGMERLNTARYSFLLSIPIILGASMVYPLVNIDLSEAVNYDWCAIIIGTIVSGVVGYLCIKYFLKFLSKFSLAVFGYYCVTAGIFAAIFFSVIE